MKPLKIKKPSKFKEKIKSFFNFDIEKDLKEEEEGTKQFEKVPVFTLTRTNLFLAILLFTIIVNILVGFDINHFYIRAILGFLFLVIVPGLLIMLCFKIRTIGFWEYLVYTVGLSISFIMFGGLIVNWTLPWLGITDKPLSLWPILICFDIFLIALGITAWIRNKDLKPFQVTVPKLDLLNNIFFIIPMCFPVLAILGAFLLNNHGSNILTMILLGGIAVYVLLLTIFRKKMNENIWPWALWMIGLSLLLMTSLRSWYVSGVDTNTELSILNSIIKIQFWSPEIFKGAYGSMLALTILPVTFYNFLLINQHFILKFAEVFVYSLTPIIVYLLFKDKSKILSFFASFFFLSTPMFIDWWPIPIRQQIAFLFFGLMILLFFKDNLRITEKKVFFILFGFSMIVSHYSTSYIAVALFLITYFLFLFLNFYKDRLKQKDVHRGSNGKQPLLTCILLLLIFLFGFLWYSQTTSTSDGIAYFLKNSLSNLGDLFNEDLQAPGNSLIEQFSLSSKQTMSELLTEYRENFEKDTSLANISSTNTFNLNIKIPSGGSYSFLSKIPFALSLVGIFEIITKLLFIVGFIFFIFSFRKTTEPFKNKILIFSLYVLIGIVVILPFISINYDLSRTFQQALFISSFFSVMGLYFLFFKFKSNIRIIFLSIFFVCYFVVFSGLYMQFIGGSGISISLNNDGLNYIKIYTHPQDVLGADWMFSNEKVTEVISDSHAFGKTKLSHSYSGFKYKNILTLITNSRALIYLRYPNLFFKVGTQFYKNIVLYYEFPTKFLNDNKNKIYNNGGSEIFK